MKTVDLSKQAPGELRHTVQLERDVLSYVGGAEVRTSEVYATVAAKVESVGGPGFVKGEVSRSRDWAVTIRFRSDVLLAHRVIFRDLHMIIFKLTEDAAKQRWMLLECQSNG